MLIKILTVFKPSISLRLHQYQDPAVTQWTSGSLTQPHTDAAANLDPGSGRAAAAELGLPSHPGSNDSLQLPSPPPPLRPQNIWWNWDAICGQCSKTAENKSGSCSGSTETLLGVKRLRGRVTCFTRWRKKVSYLKITKLKLLHVWHHFYLELCSNTHVNQAVCKTVFFFSLGHSVVLKSRLSKIGIATSLNCWFSSAQYCSL